MRHALTPTRSDIPSSLPFTLVAPTGGWNARDAVANMPQSDAEIMDNWFPEATDVRTRNGSQTYASGSFGQVETLFSYAKQNTLQLLCAAGTQVYSITTVQASGTILASSTIAQGLSNARWQYVNIGTPGGSFLVSVNGVDAGQIYNGTSWFAQTVFNGGSSPATIIPSNVCVYNRRIFYTEANTLRFAYHEQVNAIGGTVTPFDISGLCPRGGYLMGIDTWTRDAGSGPDDYICFVTSMGEVVVYVGIDPSSATTWSMVGVYKIPAPLSYRSTQKLGGDLLIATEGGVYPLSEAISGPLQQQAAISDKIRNKVSESAALYRANYGWEVRYASASHMLILNVPKSTGTATDQYVMNANTGAWTRFTGLVANCFAVHNNKLYFGGNGKVVQADVAVINVSGGGDDGTNISCDVKQAASVFQLPGRLKHFKMFRPQIASDGDLPISMGIDVDFSNSILTNIPSPVPGTFATWDMNLWDTCDWADAPFSQPQWQGVAGLGTYGQVRMTGAISNESIRWFSTDIILEPGGMV